MDLQSVAVGIVVLGAGAALVLAARHPEKHWVPRPTVGDALHGMVVAVEDRAPWSPRVQIVPDHGTPGESVWAHTVRAALPVKAGDRVEYQAMGDSGEYVVLARISWGAKP